MKILLLLVAALAAAAAAEYNGHEPAHSDYRVTEQDFRAFERGLADAAKVAPKLFPRGLGAVDAILYDTRDLYIYSKSSTYRLPRFGRRAGYQVYRVAQGRPVQEHEMAICSAGSGPASVDVLRTVTERTLSCAPWGTFGRIQKERRSVYRFIEGYRDTIIHEYGHAYWDRYLQDPTPEMREIQALIAKMKLSPGTDPARAANEGFATWCELTAARTLYPKQYARLLAQVRRLHREDDADGHDAGLRAAAALVQKRAGR